MSKKRPRDLLKPGVARRTFVRQRLVEDPPFTNCRIVDTVRMLHYAGVRTPDRRALVQLIRDKTGRPENEGTNADNIQSAMGTIAPWVPIKSGLWQPERLLRALASGRITASVGTDYHELPTKQRRWSPGYVGGHQVGLAGAVKGPKGWRVLLVDPLGMGDYKGDMVAWSKIKGAIHGSGGRVLATTLEKESAVRVRQKQIEVFEPTAKVKVPAGTRLYTIGVKSIALEPGQKFKKDRTFPTDSLWLIRQSPEWLPSGRFYRILRKKKGDDEEYVRVKSTELVLAEPEVIEEDELFEPDEVDAETEAALGKDDGVIDAVADADPAGG